GRCGPTLLPERRRLRVSSRGVVRPLGGCAVRHSFASNHRNHGTSTDARGLADATTQMPQTRMVSGFALWERRGRDLNPRPTEPPVTVFETAAFDRSATPPGGALLRGGEGGIRTLEGGDYPLNALAG